jgi:hypothetical protein
MQISLHWIVRINLKEIKMALASRAPNLLFRFGVDTQTVSGSGDTSGIVTGYNDLSAVAPTTSRVFIADLGPNWADYSLAMISFRCSGATASSLRLSSRDTVLGQDRILPYAYSAANAPNSNNVTATSTAAWTVRCNGRYLVAQFTNNDAVNPLTWAGAFDQMHLNVFPG